MWVRDDLILQIEFHLHLSRVSLCDFRCIFYLCQRGSGMTRPYGSSSIRTTLGSLHAIYAFMYLSSGKSRYSSTWLRFLKFCTPPCSLVGSYYFSGGSPSRYFALGIRLPSWPPIVLSSSLSSIMVRSRVASLMRHSTNASSWPRKLRPLMMLENSQKTIVI